MPLTIPLKDLDSEELARCNKRSVLPAVAMQIRRPVIDLKNLLINYCCV
jgi:hypothetical protein